MFLYTVIVLAIYSALILFFVPLIKIGTAQEWVKKQVKKAIDRINK